jgi:hypothetical protein
MFMELMNIIYQIRDFTIHLGFRWEQNALEGGWEEWEIARDARASGISGLFMASFELRACWRRGRMLLRGV